MYLRDQLNATVPQSEPLNARQVPNSAGGYSFAVDHWTRLDRFLILGAEGPTLYATERKQVFDNVASLEQCLAEDGPRVVARIVEISDGGRAPKNEPALFALAKAASYGHRAISKDLWALQGAERRDTQTRFDALRALPKVARTGTHLLHFAEYVNSQRGWGPALCKAVSRWFLDRRPEDLVYQAIKYRQRDGWSLRDLLRLSHPKAQGVQNQILHWIVKGWEGIGDEPHPDAILERIWSFEKLQTLTKDSVAAAACIIETYHLPREAVPTELLKEPRIWEALFPDLGITALLRNLPTLTRVGLLDSGTYRQQATARLTNQGQLIKGRVHPITLLTAHLTYASGHSLRGDSTWQPKAQISDALTDAFYLAFKAVEPTNKRHLLAVDVSGSMGAGQINGVPNFSPYIAAAAMSLVTANVEPDCEILGFSHTLVPLNISPRQRLDDVVRRLTSTPMGGGTDCALPMVHALQHKIPVDVFVVYTDSETWYGRIHPVEALRQYRQQMGIPAKLVVQAFVANQFSIADPADGGMMDVVGLDSAAPAVIADFIRQ